MKSNNKILFIDIEWRPATALVWGMWKQDISPVQLVDHGGMLCFCAHWEGERGYEFWSEWEHGRTGMARAALDLLTEADAVVGYNSEKYDLPKLTGEILLAGLSPPPPPTSIDVLKTVKRFGFNMNRLAYIGPLLGLGGKVSHEGFNLWKKVMAGEEKAQNTMRRYCIQDVKLLVKLYERIKPFIRSHPFFGQKDAKSCPTCGSTKVQSRGHRRTCNYLIQRLHCQTCGAWSEGSRKKV